MKFAKATEGNMLTILKPSRVNLQPGWDKACVLFHVASMAPFNVQRHMPILLNAIYPNGNFRVQMRCPETVSRHTSQFVEEIRDDIYSILNEAKQDVKLFSLTTDLWSDYRGLSYFGLIVHWCDNEFNLHKLVPFVMLMEEKHTGKNWSLRIAEYITKLGLDSTEIKLVMTLDNASNNKVNILNIYLITVTNI